MTLIDAKEAAEILKVKPHWLADRCKPSCPRARQVPHVHLPGSRLVRFFREEIEAWRDARFPPLDQWEREIESKEVKTPTRTSRDGHAGITQ